jgi:hypothetical protein
MPALARSLRNHDSNRGDAIMTETHCHGPDPASGLSQRVVYLDQHRARRLEASVTEVRARIYGLQRARMQAELRAGSLWRELSALQRELRDCRERIAQSAPDAVAEQRASYNRAGSRVTATRDASSAVAWPRAEGPA